MPSLWRDYLPFPGSLFGCYTLYLCHGFEAVRQIIKPLGKYMWVVALLGVGILLVRPCLLNFMGCRYCVKRHDNNHQYTLEITYHPDICNSLDSYCQAISNLHLLG